MTGSYYFNMEESDLVLSTEVSHDFISNNKKLQISPAVGLYFGSQTFYEQYVITKGGTQGQGNGSPSIANGKIIEAEVFNLMAIDFSIPFWYEHKSFSFLVLPTYVLPKNNIKYAVDDIIYEEKVSETLYWILGINYKL